jgi:iron complex outermembrane receptor protein
VPTRIERDISIDATLPTANPLIRLVGNREFGAERLIAYEAGFRWLPLSKLSMDIAAFHNRYAGLASLELRSVSVRPGDGRTVAEVENQNLTDGRTSGLEVMVTTTPAPWWRLTVSSAALAMKLEPQGLDANRGALLDGATPRHQLGIRSTMDLGGSVEADAMFRHLLAIRRTPDLTIGAGIPGYAELDVRLAWRRWRRVELALVGQSLLHGEHIEFGAPEARGAVERSVYAQLTWRR